MSITLSNAVALELISEIESGLKHVSMTTAQQFSLTLKLMKLRTVLGGSAMDRTVACVGKRGPIAVVKDEPPEAA